MLGIPFLNQTEITVLLTNYEGEEGTIDARIDVVPIDTTGDPEDFVTAVQESTPHPGALARAVLPRVGQA